MGMTAHLPPSLQALFAPRPPIPFLPPISKRNCKPFEGVAQYLKEFEDPDTVDYSTVTGRWETRKERIERKRVEAKKRAEAKNR